MNELDYKTYQEHYWWISDKGNASAQLPLVSTTAHITPIIIIIICKKKLIFFGEFFFNY